MSLRIGIGNIDLRNTRAFSWSRYWATRIECYEIWKITGAGNLIGLKRGDILTVGGTAGNYTFKVPNTASYQTYDINYIWFQTDLTWRTVTEAELVGYDFSRTIVKYGNIFPYSIDYIMILASAPAIAEENKMRDDFNLSFWWSGVLSFHGVIKGNRITGKSIWPDDFITDIDGNIYTSVVIGTQRWLEQNLKVTKYRNGDPITNITNNATWAARAAEAYRWYLDDPITYAAYGILYNFWVVADARGIAPVGYHIATSAEWVIMNTFLGGTGFAGGHLKEAGLSHWSTPNTGADNSSGFTGLGAGYIHPGTGVAENNKSWTVFWTSTEVDATTAIAYALDLLSDDVTPLMTDLKKRGGSIRCIKD